MILMEAIYVISIYLHVVEADIIIVFHVIIYIVSWRGISICIEMEIPTCYAFELNSLDTICELMHVRSGERMEWYTVDKEYVAWEVPGRDTCHPLLLQGAHSVMHS